ncbi:hypothetical protein BX666DRAFT_2031848 [Dichotomocladium elegans]|nr:hypothetical protein BX666DRAFT_2031848 [Dichotomocladium elegans]
MEVDDSKGIALRRHYANYKASAVKIGLEEAQVQYATIECNDLGTERWKFIDVPGKEEIYTGTPSEAHRCRTATSDMLREFYYSQTINSRFTHQPDDAGRFIRSASQILRNESFLHDHAQEVVAVLDLFNELEDQDPLRQGTLQDVYDAFIHLQTRCEIIRCIVQYDPLSIPEITERLYESAGRLLPSKYQIYLSEMIYTVVQEHPSYAARVRFELVGRQLLPELITRLTVIYCGDEIDFLNGVFHGLPSWFMAQSSNSVKHFMRIKNKIFEEIERGSLNDKENKVELAMAIRALAGLTGYLGIKLTEEEVSKALKILQAPQPERIVKLLLSLILVASDQAIRLQRDFINVITHLLRSSISEMPMLMMVYFQTDQFGQIESMARSILDMHVAIPKLGLFEMQKLFRSIQQSA